MLQLPAFQVEMIRWDGMHTINLGVDLWVIASVIKKLFEYDLFGGTDMDEGDRLLVGYDEFRTWARSNKVQHLCKTIYSFVFKVGRPSLIPTSVLAYYCMSPSIKRPLAMY